MKWTVAFLLSLSTISASFQSNWSRGHMYRYLYRTEIEIQKRELPCDFRIHVLDKRFYDGKINGRPNTSRNTFWHHNYCSFHISLSKTFFAITFLLLVISSWNFHDVCQHFLYNQKQEFRLIRQKKRNLPIDPHCKNRPLW